MNLDNYTSRKSQKLLVISLVYHPDGVSTANIVSELVTRLRSDYGYATTVVTTTPHYNFDSDLSDRQPLRRRWGKILQESRSGETPVFHVFARRKASRTLGRIVDHLCFHAVGTMAALRLGGSVDLVFAPSPPLTIGLMAWIVATLRRAPFLYNVQEIFPDAAIRLGLVKNRILIRFLQGLERFIYRRAAVIVVISDQFREQLLAKGVPEAKVAVIPNFVDTEFIRPGEHVNEFSRECGIDQTFNIVYSGNLGMTQDFLMVLEAADLLRGEGTIRFVLVGDGVRRSWLDREIKGRQLINVKLIPYQPQHRVPQIYASADLCMIPMRKGTALDTFPSKIYSIMAAGRAVVASADGGSELESLIHSVRCGYTVDPGDAAGMVACIRSAVMDRADVERRAARGRDWVVERHSPARIAREYHDLFQRAIAVHRGKS